MTDDRPPTDDELVTAVLDGEATDDEVARVRRDPALAARLAELEAVADAVATPVAPLDDAVVDDLVARALAVADADRPGDDEVPAGATDPADRPGAVVDLAARRRRTTWLVAAAVAVIALVGIPLALAADDEPTPQFAAVGSAVAGGGAATDAAADAAGPAEESLTAEEEAARSGALPTTVAPSAAAPTAGAATTSVALPDAGLVRTEQDLRRWATAAGLPATSADADALDDALASQAERLDSPAPCPGTTPEPPVGWAPATTPAAGAVLVLARPVGPAEVHTVVVLVDLAGCRALLEVDLAAP